MTRKKHSRSSQPLFRGFFRKPGVFTVFSPESTSYRRLKWYTADELESRRQKMVRHLETIHNPHLQRSIKHEIKTIQSILS